MIPSEPFAPKLDEAQLRDLSNLALAHMGDAVYEVLVRTWLCTHGRMTSRDLHRETVGYVSAPAQAHAAEKLLPLLTEEELQIYKRGRNAKVNSVPHHADASQYHAATGLESLFGWLYLKGEQTRIGELFDHIMEEENAS